MSRFAVERLRAVVRGSGGGRGDAPAAPPALTGSEADRLARALDAALGVAAGSPHVVARRVQTAGARYGRGVLRDYATVCPVGLDVLAGRGDAAAGVRADGERVVYLDLETTGLSSGAATVPFVVGLGWFGADGFETRQYVLPGFAAERGVLDAVADHLRRASVVVTFNGKSFDLPVLESRWAYHRRPSPAGHLLHVDLLHPARRLWRGEDGTLGGLERAVLGVWREGDVPGAEIPGRYVAFLRGADAALLAPVLEHNRLDLVSLGALTGIACRVIEGGARAATSAAQALGLGRLLAKGGRQSEAVACYRRAASAAASTVASDAVRADALSKLASIWRRQRRHEAAARAWGELLSLRYAPLRHTREASVALAVHHEHRGRDPVTARRLAHHALALSAPGHTRRRVEHRLARLERKIRDAGAGTQLAWPVERRSAPGSGEHGLEI